MAGTGGVLVIDDSLTYTAVHDLTDIRDIELRAKNQRRPLIRLPETPPAWPAWTRRGRAARRPGPSCTPTTTATPPADPSPPPHTPPSGPGAPSGDVEGGGDISDSVDEGAGIDGTNEPAEAAPADAGAQGGER